MLSLGWVRTTYEQGRDFPVAAMFVVKAALVPSMCRCSFVIMKVRLQFCSMCMCAQHVWR
jgi:hypothetical protein